ncbi:hypothetical protein BD626DRAFT_489125 [Schizophyllum amplum]|uniref:Uncharacterized protein n=1 Tax=Schizophyllum amplum TaxID=97359 RepID=A0A550CL79_9AGAR|nr:hypothetical protein BD626DRAFT_489125 [Auriculariopsis ampla]
MRPAGLTPSNCATAIFDAAWPAHVRRPSRAVHCGAMQSEPLLRRVANCSPPAPPSWSALADFVLTCALDRLLSEVRGCPGCEERTREESDPASVPSFGLAIIFYLPPRSVRDKRLPRQPSCFAPSLRRRNDYPILSVSSRSNFKLLCASRQAFPSV